MLPTIKRTSLTILLCISIFFASGQSLAKFADSLRMANHIPELCYAVVSSDSVIDIQYLGVRKAGTTLIATPNDRFRIGSNTKAITSFIAATLVKSGQLKWDTKFFDLYPELKRQANKSYYGITLIDLLSFRAPLAHYTYTDALPTYAQIETSTKNENDARLNFVKWVLRQKPIRQKKEFYFSNPSYVVAGLMLERVSGKTYETLVRELGTVLNIDFEFANPNATDTLQTWGHGEGNAPEIPGDNYKLNWLMAAGNINVTLRDYIKFIQLQLKGLHGKSDLLPEQDFNLLHFGRPTFALGWFCDTTKSGHIVSHNLGNPGTFITSVTVIKDIDRAYIIFANAQNEETSEGMAALLEEMKRRYGF